MHDEKRIEQTGKGYSISRQKIQMYDRWTALNTHSRTKGVGKEERVCSQVKETKLFFGRKKDKPDDEDKKEERRKKLAKRHAGCFCCADKQPKTLRYGGKKSKQGTNRQAL
jgi:hypothetical protein